MASTAESPGATADHVAAIPTPTPVKRQKQRTRGRMRSRKVHTEGTTTAAAVAPTPSPQSLSQHSPSPHTPVKPGQSSPEKLARAAASTGDALKRAGTKVIDAVHQHTPGAISRRLGVPHPSETNSPAKSAGAPKLQLKYDKPRTVVVVGGGPAGVNVIRGLKRAGALRQGAARVILIDRKDTYHWPPAAVRAAVAPIHPAFVNESADAAVGKANAPQCIQ